MTIRLVWGESLKLLLSYWRIPSLRIELVITSVIATEETIDFGLINVQVPRLRHLMSLVGSL